MRVLVIEDEPELLTALSQALREDGYAVDEAADGAEGLFKATSWEYDAVVLDLMLPHVSGWEVLDATRSEADLGTIPVIVISAAERQRPVGVAEFFKKPFNLERLLQSIRERTSSAD